MHFDYYIRKECNLFGKQFDNLLNNMKKDDNLEVKHKECLEYYKGEELILYKLKIEPIINRILKPINKEKFKEYTSNKYEHIRNYKDLDDNVEKVPNFIYF